MEYTLGQSIFERIWVSAPSSTEAADGLGPLFNARSCVACHPAGARPQSLVDEKGVVPSLLMRLGLADGGPDPVYGVQLQNEGVAGVPAEGRVVLAFEAHEARLADGSGIELRKPVAAMEALAYGPLSPETKTGLRIGPAIHGIGPLDRIANDDILAGADPDDKDGDGISGRPAWLDQEQTKLGRFGWKAVQPDMINQNAHAFMADLGLSTELFPDPQGECTTGQAACRAAPSGASPQYENLEVSPLLMTVLDRFVAEAVLPAHGPQPPADPAMVARGKKVFAAAGCQACHRESYEVTWPVEAKAPRRISPYSDLLLHDMGPGLAEFLPEGAALGVEWRTAPLWGLRWALDAKGEGALLHDGRARTLQEAILWHGGEAQAARDHVAGLSSDERAALVTFLSNL
ncbi:di-heme oxidoredictase family protein [Dongia sp.]|uniref:di-heme oxidoredictase family protein n=1 Tax=Dongia sp. TaxID=1977262 RepID=UPI0035ADD769